MLRDMAGGGWGFPQSLAEEGTEVEGAAQEWAGDTWWVPEAGLSDSRSPQEGPGPGACPQRAGAAYGVCAPMVSRSLESKPWEQKEMERSTS